MSTPPIWKIKFYGVRGSIPVCDQAMSKFGGNTTCLLLDLLINDAHEEVTVIFDAGTGIRELGKDILADKVRASDYILIHFTHFHWDHIQGFPFFAPAYIPDQKIALFSPHFSKQESRRLKEVFAHQMQSEFFPVELEKMGADMRFYTSEEFQTSLRLDKNVTFSYFLNNHPGGAYSYRLEGYGKSLVICTDLEHGEQVDPAVVDFCKDADLLIHEAQYTDEQLLSHRGWGHSSYGQALEVAKRANVGRLYITHHDPDHDDTFLQKMEDQCRLVFPNCTLAREGMEVYV
ncbi:MAG: MBL fold metallo-hydrolase [Bacteroidota bacterium]